MSNVANLAVRDEAGPLRLNLGCGRNILPGWVNCDLSLLPGIDYRVDLNDCARTPLPFMADSVDAFLLSHTIEHIPNVLPLMQELHRIAKPGAICTVRVPYGSSDDAWEDPTHVRAYFLQSWLYFSQPAYWRADYGYRGDWQADTIELVVGNSFSGMPVSKALAKVQCERNVVVEMIATLRAVKPVREPKRELQAQPQIKFVVLP